MRADTDFLESLFDLPPLPELPYGTIPLMPVRPVPPSTGIKVTKDIIAAPAGIAVADLPDVIQRQIDAYMANPRPNSMLLLAFPAGAGKTTAMVKLAETMAETMRVMYCAPRHDFRHDIRALSQHPDRWLEWQPRRGDEKGGVATCRYPQQINAWMAKGHQARDFCTQFNVCGWKYMANQCVYHAQARREEPIIFAQHAHAVLSHPLLSHVGLVIGDELPLSAFLNPWHIPREYLVVDDTEITDALYDLLKALQALCRRGMAELSGVALIDALGGAQAVIDAFTGYVPSTERNAPVLASPDDAASTDYAHVDRLQQVLVQEAIAYGSGMSEWVRRIKVRADGIEILGRHDPADLPAHVIWCDATANAAIYEALFKRPVTIVQVDVAHTGRVFQLYGSLHTKATILPFPNAEPETHAKAQRYRDGIKERIAYLAQGYDRVGVISYEKIVEDLAPDGALTAHFYGNRGSNAMQHCDALFVIGTPMPNPVEIERTAAMIFGDRLEPFRTEWSTREVSYVGQPASTDVPNFWDDEDLQLILWLYREAELIQSLNRSRLIRNHTDVYVFTRLPLGIPVTLWSDAHIYGCVDINGKALTGIAPSQFPALVQWIDATLKEHGGSMSAKEIATAAGVSMMTALRWCELMGQTRHFEWVYAPRTGKKGRPSRVLKGRKGR